MIKWDFKIEKPLCYILYGHSLEELDNRIEEFKDLDVCWATLNKWQVAESILDKIGKKLDYVFLFGANGHPCPYAKMIGEGMERGNTLLESLYQCVENDVKQVFIFGADGFNDRPQFGYKIATSTPQTMYPDDLGYFNSNYHEIDEKGTEIYNTSQISQYCIPKITIDECITKIKANQEIMSF